MQTGRLNKLFFTLQTSINISFGSYPFSIILFTEVGTFSLPLELGKEKWDIDLINLLFKFLFCVYSV